MGNKPPFTSVLLHSLVDHLGISKCPSSLIGNWEIGWSFQDFESWNIQCGQKNTRQLRTPEWKQPKHAGRWLARLFFYSKIFTIKFIFMLVFSLLYELSIKMVAMATRTDTKIKYKAVPMATNA